MGDYRGRDTVAAGLAAATVVAVSTAFVVWPGGPRLAAIASPTPVAIAVDADSAEQVVLGEIYKQIFESMGYAAAVTALPSDASPGGTDAVEAVRSGEVDLVVACTGTLLAERDPQAATTLTSAARGDSDGSPGGGSGKGSTSASSEDTYDASVATLPGELRTVDPSPAQGCGDDGAMDVAGALTAASLPHNIIPVFRAATFDRRTVQRVNFITRVMATEDIDEMAEDIRDGDSVHNAVADWLAEYAGITAGIDTVPDGTDPLPAG